MEQSYAPYGPSAAYPSAHTHNHPSQSHPKSPDSSCSPSPSAYQYPPQYYHDQNQYAAPYPQTGQAGWYEAYPAQAQVPTSYAGELRTWFDFSNSCYLKGFLIGAGATLILTNSSVQKALVRGTVKVWSLVQGGVEEVKEQFRDVKAEMSQEE